MKTKVCNKCGKRKGISAFPPRRDRPIGIRGRCRECERERYREYDARNREERRRKSREYYKKHPEKQNTPRDKSYQKLWRENNREKALGYYKKWRERNPEKRKEILLNWEKKHPESAAERHRKRRARMKNALGWMPPYPEGILFGEQEGLCFYCRVDLEKVGWHMEHKIPLSRGGKHEWGNVCLSCSPCNLEKHTKTDAEFLS